MLDLRNINPPGASEAQCSGATEGAAERSTPLAQALSEQFPCRLKQLDYIAL